MVLPSPDAGPSTRSTSSSMAAAHGAFPTALALNATHDPSSSIPENQTSLWKQITDASSPQALGELATVLRTLSSPSKLGEHVKRDYLLLEGMDLGSYSDAQLGRITLALVYVLSERLNRHPKAAAENLEIAYRVAVNADPAQLDIVPARVAEFAWAILRAAQKANDTARAIIPLQQLLRRAARGVYFNAVHAVFLEACLSIRNIQLGYESLYIQYSNVVPGTSVLDVLTYYHHAGTVSAAAGDFALASELFIFGASIPGETPSAIRLACAKRAVLCELLSTGKQPQFPKDVSQNITRLLEKAMEPYVKLAKAFENRKWDQVNEVVQGEVAVSMFDRDCNRNLVLQILDSIPKRRILDLRKTYSRLTLADLAAKVNAPPQTVAAAIDLMVTRGEIRATIEGTPEIVTFIEDDDYASPEQMAKLANAHALAQNVNTDLGYANRAMLLNKKLLFKRAQAIQNNDKRGPSEPIKSRGEFEFGDDIGGVRGVASNYADMGF